MTDYEELQTIGTSAYESIKEMVERLDVDWERLESLRQDRDDMEEEAPGLTREEWEELCGLEALADDCESEDDAFERIYEDPLEISVRSAWCPLSEYPGPPQGYKILLSTGGPATRIIGELDECGIPETARLEVQDWFTPWTKYAGADEDVLLRYARTLVP